MSASPLRADMLRHDREDWDEMRHAPSQSVELGDDKLPLPPASHR
jgi:hypothetical protein